MFRSVHMCTVCLHHQSKKKVLKLPRTGATGSWELPSMNVGGN